MFLGSRKITSVLKRFIFRRVQFSNFISGEHRPVAWGSFLDVTNKQEGGTENLLLGKTPRRLNSRRQRRGRIQEGPGMKGAREKQTLVLKFEFGSVRTRDTAPRN